MDFGAGRRLERFGSILCDRPCPAADLPPAHPEMWTGADARFTGSRVGEGTWTLATKLKNNWVISCPISESLQFSMNLQLSPGGNVHLFPEQWASWQWIAGQVRGSIAGLRLLNLFAYTGGSTLAAAVAGAEVTHVDASPQAVAAAADNARISRLSELPIRWIVDDVAKFCRRELRRGRHYDAIVLDPPTYGHGPKRETWQIAEQLVPLLSLCGELTDGKPTFVLLSCHTPGMGPNELAESLIQGIFAGSGRTPLGGRLLIHATDGRPLQSGAYSRWP
jgi:23S rRNA (cytosine1962-C5)-methyltransferase